MSKIKICREVNCHNAATTADYCRLHYLRNWKKIQEDKKRKAAKKLNSYIEDIVRKNPEKYVEEIKKDLESPGFEQEVEERFGYDDDENIFDDPAYDEEIGEMIRRLKVEKGY